MAATPGTGSKAKGSAGERELAALLTSYALDSGVRLDLARNLEQTRGGGHDLTGLEQYNMAVECKRVEALAVTAWWRQAVRQADAINCIPVLAYRQNRKPWTFMVRVWVYPCNTALDISMTGEHFRVWFNAQIAACVTAAQTVSTGS
jgi:hypothetical protein